MNYKLTVTYDGTPKIYRNGKSLALTQDMVEMIEDASPEERQYLEKRVSALASKIG